MPPQCLLYTSSRSDSDSFAQASEKELAFRVSQLRMEQVNPLTRFRCDTCFRRAVVYRMDLTRIHLTRMDLTRIPFDSTGSQGHRLEHRAQGTAHVGALVQPEALRAAPRALRVRGRSVSLMLCSTRMAPVFVGPVDLTRYLFV